jgi:hypothetical protein
MNKKGSAIASLFLIIVTGAVIQIMHLIRALATENGNSPSGISAKSTTTACSFNDNACGAIYLSRKFLAMGQMNRNPTTAGLGPVRAGCLNPFRIVERLS